MLPAVAQPGSWSTLTASDGFSGRDFGQSVAVSGDIVVGGSPGAGFASHGSPRAGTVYVFEKPTSGSGNMTEVAELTSSNGAVDDWFGSSVAISGNTIVVGATEFSGGAAYVFVEPTGGWTSMTETAKLTASDGQVGDEFGKSVAISNDTIVVGSCASPPFEPLASSSDISPIGLPEPTWQARAGVYVYSKPALGWTNATESARLTASDGSLLSGQIAISGDTIVVGAPRLP